MLRTLAVKHKCHMSPGEHQHKSCVQRVVHANRQCFQANTPPRPLLGFQLPGKTIVRADKNCYRCLQPLQGVYKNQGYWRARIFERNTDIYLGHWATRDEVELTALLQLAPRDPNNIRTPSFHQLSAADAYDKAVLKLRGPDWASKYGVNNEEGVNGVDISEFEHMNFEQLVLTLRFQVGSPRPCNSESRTHRALCITLCYVVHYVVLCAAHLTTAITLCVALYYVVHYVVLVVHYVALRCALRCVMCGAPHNRRWAGWRVHCAGQTEALRKRATREIQDEIARVP
eukprot:1180581-Prorocentrum_minimum.AAC.1